MTDESKALPSWQRQGLERALWVTAHGGFREHTTVRATEADLAAVLAAMEPERRSVFLSEVSSRLLSLSEKVVTQLSAELTAERGKVAALTGRRAPVQASPKTWEGEPRKMGEPGYGPGTVAWSEHELAWSAYAVRYSGQSAERMAERGGFSWGELCHFLGRPPTTWTPGQAGARGVPSYAQLLEERDSLRATLATVQAERDEAIDQKDGAALLLEREREKARAIASNADADAWRKLIREEARSGAAPSALELAAEDAVTAWLDHERTTNPAWWPSWEEMSEIERAHRGHPLVDVIRRIVGLEGAPLSQVLDTLRFKYFVCGPWRARVLRKLSEARAALGCETEDDVPEAARRLAAERDGMRAFFELHGQALLSHCANTTERKGCGQECDRAEEALSIILATLPKGTKET
jgi:hypothetical protein